MAVVAIQYKYLWSGRANISQECRLKPQTGDALFGPTLYRNTILDATWCTV